MRKERIRILAGIMITAVFLAGAAGLTKGILNHNPPITAKAPTIYSHTVVEAMTGCQIDSSGPAQELWQKELDIFGPGYIEGIGNNLLDVQKGRPLRELEIPVISTGSVKIEGEIAPTYLTLRHTSTGKDVLVPAIVREEKEGKPSYVEFTLPLTTAPDTLFAFLRAAEQGKERDNAVNAAVAARNAVLANPHLAELLGFTPGQEVEAGVFEKALLAELQPKPGEPGRGTPKTSAPAFESDLTKPFLSTQLPLANIADAGIVDMDTAKKVILALKEPMKEAVEGTTPLKDVNARLAEAPHSDGEIQLSPSLVKVEDVLIDAEGTRGDVYLAIAGKVPYFYVPILPPALWGVCVELPAQLPLAIVAAIQDMKGNPELQEAMIRAWAGVDETIWKTVPNGSKIYEQLCAYGTFKQSLDNPASMVAAGIGDIIRIAAKDAPKPSVEALESGLGLTKPFLSQPPSADMGMDMSLKVIKQGSIGSVERGEMALSEANAKLAEAPHGDIEIRLLPSLVKLKDVLILEGTRGDVYLGVIGDAAYYHTLYPDLWGRCAELPVQLSLAIAAALQDEETTPELQEAMIQAWAGVSEKAFQGNPLFEKTKMRLLAYLQAAEAGVGGDTVTQVASDIIVLAKTSSGGTPKTSAPAFESELTEAPRESVAVATATQAGKADLGLFYPQEGGAVEVDLAATTILGKRGITGLNYSQDLGRDPQEVIPKIAEAIEKAGIPEDIVKRIAAGEITQPKDAVFDVEIEGQEMELAVTANLPEEKLSAVVRKRGLTDTTSITERIADSTIYEKTQGLYVIDVDTLVNVTAEPATGKEVFIATDNAFRIISQFLWFNNLQNTDGQPSHFSAVYGHNLTPEQVVDRLERAGLPTSLLFGTLIFGGDNIVTAIDVARKNIKQAHGVDIPDENVVVRIAQQNKKLWDHIVASRCGFALQLIMAPTGGQYVSNAACLINALEALAGQVKPDLLQQYISKVEGAGELRGTAVEPVQDTGEKVRSARDAHTSL